MKKAPLVFGIGQCSLDHLGLVPVYPPPDVKCEFTSLILQGGGPAATALVALKRWGARCHIAGVLGDDGFGEQIKALLDAEGIDTTGLQIRKRHQSQFAFIASEPALARRTIFYQMPTGEPLRPEEINIDILLKSRALHTDGLFAEASLFACRKAKESGIPVIVDAGTLRDGMLEMAKLSDCFVTSEVFSNAFAETPAETCRKLAAMGVRLPGVTLGKRGYVALVDGRFIEKEAYPAKAIDTTGCGDVFHAGLIYGILHGWSAEKCLDLGAWAAARVSEKMGGRSGIPDIRHLKSRYPADPGR
ncbi:MAG TPA: PfkB family carbohydrate kinase [Smithellaceae bacterium]|nr:PfkB family carbohydrate kinase [Smithellaceae bacterium]HRS81912.1 PfkB family carbohydrate kinase [Smithellaceae bacterium]HRV44121.1 PfkB family carbohydrate kinase [Smithellaceae bacterium]